METTQKMDLKQKTAYITAIVAFVLGWGLTIAGFCLPPKGDVSDSVLWILGQALIYTASVLGITMYFKSKVVELQDETRRYVDEEIRRKEGEDES